MKFKDKTIWSVKRFSLLDKESNRQKCKIAIWCMFLCFMIFSARLLYLQILRGDYYRDKSEHNRTRQVNIQPPRGKILDRKGRLLAGVKPCFNICLFQEDVTDMEALLAKLIPLLDEPDLEIRTHLRSENNNPKYLPIVIKRGTDWETLCRVESRLYNLPGVFIEVNPVRKYPWGSIAPHLLGYLGQISKEDIDKECYKGARPGDLVGKCGIEEKFQNELAGIKGQRRIEVDSCNRLVRVIDEKLPIQGKDLYLSIDFDLQKASEEAMKEYVGALVAMNPQNGQILALVSSPAFDPNLFVTGINKETWEKLNDPVTRPLQNKALQGRYAPGSTFKIVTAAAALEEEIITENSTFTCTGVFCLGRGRFRCWKSGGHGQTDLYKALVESCDSYFYQVGDKLGIEKIADYAKAFGLGPRTGIDLSNERDGFIATPDWKLATRNEPWQKGETVITAIGQGFTLVTPLQMACLISSVANDGTLYKPIYIEKIVGSGGQIAASFESDLRCKLPISHSNLRIIKKALVGVVNDKKGTGKQCRLPYCLVAGKTGTAQVIRQTVRRQNEDLDWINKDHAWFIAYAPAEKPELAIAVVCEHAGHGGSVAAPIARKVIETWWLTNQGSPSPRLSLM